MLCKFSYIRVNLLPWNPNWLEYLVTKKLGGLYYYNTANRMSISDVSTMGDLRYTCFWNRDQSGKH